MNLEQRISKLENRIGIGDEIPPIIVITIANQSKGSQDKGTPTIIVVPGQIGGPRGITMFRDKDENPSLFLKRCEKKHAEFYA